MNNFPDMTEEHRDSLIDWAKGYIYAAEIYVASNPADRSGKAYLELLQIALGALTAEPVGWGLRSLQESGHYGSWLHPTPRDQSYLDYEPHKYENVKLYTTPPVPVMKSVEAPRTDCIGWVRDTIHEHDEKWKEAIRAAGYEVGS